MIGLDLYSHPVGDLAVERWFWSLAACVSAVAAGRGPDRAPGVGFARVVGRGARLAGMNQTQLFPSLPNVCERHHAPGERSFQL